MARHALPRQARIFVESTFATPPADWTASGSNILLIEPDVSGVVESVVDNENIRPYALGVYDKIHTLRSEGTYSFASYVYSSTANAAEAGTAVAYPLTDLLHNAFGGRDLGLAIGFAAGTAAAPEVDSETGYVVGDWIFAFDASAGTGRFQRIIDLPGADVLTLDRDLAFTPGASDVAHAVIEVYLHELSLTQHTHAQHKTLSILVQGQADDDATDIAGSKLAATIEPITEGEPLRVSFEGTVTTFRSEELQVESLTGTVYGEAGLVPGRGRTTTLELAPVGDPLAAQLVRGPITPTVGITWAADGSPAGVEGRNGHVAEGFGETMIEISVDYSDTWATAFRAGTHYHLLVQVGNTPTGAMAIYYPNLEIAEEPVRVDVGGLSSCKIVFVAHMDDHPDSQIDATALSGDNFYKATSPMQVLFVA
jgi:hypothetical protein